MFKCYLVLKVQLQGPSSKKPSQIIHLVRIPSLLCFCPDPRLSALHSLCSRYFCPFQTSQHKLL